MQIIRIHYLIDNIKQNTFRSYKHQVYTETINKVALSSTDDKCFIDDNNINTKTFSYPSDNLKPGADKANPKIEYIKVER